jgi:hypothetical protein
MALALIWISSTSTSFRKTYSKGRPAQGSLYLGAWGSRYWAARAYDRRLSAAGWARPFSWFTSSDRAVRLGWAACSLCRGDSQGSGAYWKENNPSLPVYQLFLHQYMVYALPVGICLQPVCHLLRPGYTKERREYKREFARTLSASHPQLLYHRFLTPNLLLNNFNFSQRYD